MVTGHRRQVLGVVVDSSWDEAARGEPITTRIYAEGICCPNEIPLILRMLEPLAGVTQVRSPPSLLHSSLASAQ